MSAVLQFDRRVTINKDFTEAQNLTDRFEPDDLKKLGQMCFDGYDHDLHSRLAWERRMEAAMDLAMQVQKEKTFPWPNCANVIFPLVSIGAMQFSSRSYSNIIQGSDVVRYRVIGEDSDGKLTARADRISRHMSWQCLEQDTAWEEQHDRLLLNLAIVGVNFIKTYYDSDLRYPVSELVMARDLVLNYFARSVEACPRKTHTIPMSRNEIVSRVRDGVYRDVLDESWFNTLPSVTAQPMQTPQQDNRQGQTPPRPDEDTPFQFLEQHRLLDLDKDGYSEPYIVTLDKVSRTVVRVVSRFGEHDIDRVGDRASAPIRSIRAWEYFTKYGFIPAPDGGIYDIGFGVLLGPLNESVNSGINQMLDAGTMANSNGGLYARGVKMKGGVFTLAPWEWKRVDSTGDDLRKNLFPLPSKDPSSVMFQLVGLIINYADRLSGATDTMVGENPGQNTPAETSRNMTEQGMQVYSSIFKRVWRSMKEEFKKRHRLNSRFMPPRQSFAQGEQGFALREDYSSNPDLVCPVADPHITSNAMRFSQAQVVREAAHQVPGYNIPEVEKRFLRSLRIDSIEQIYPGPDKVPPLPNPKVQIEQMRLQGREMQFKYKEKELMIKLQSEREKVGAEIELLKAQTVEIVASIGAEKAAQQIKAFEVAMSALQRHQELLNERIGMLMSGGDSEGKEGDNGGGVRGLADAPGQSGVPGGTGGMAGGPQGAMGGPAVPTGGGGSGDGSPAS